MTGPELCIFSLYVTESQHVSPYIILRISFTTTHVSVFTNILTNRRLLLPENTIKTFLQVCNNGEIIHSQQVFTSTLKRKIYSC